MVSTSTYFNSHIKDGVTKQIFCLDFEDSADGALALSEDGDFVAEPITIDEQAYSTDDIEPGDCSAATLSCVFNNTDRRFYGFSFGKAQSYVGVLNTATPTPDADTIWTLSWVGTLHIYRDGVTAATYAPVGLPTVTITGSENANYACAKEGTPTYIYLVDPNGLGWKINATDGTYTTFTPSDFLCLKATRRGIAQVNATNIFIFKDETQYTYDTCPCGLFNIEKPNNTSVRELHITDAYDNMRLLDADASAWAKALVMTPGSPMTNEDIVNGVCTQCGLTFDSMYTPTGQQTENKFANSYITYREIISQIAKNDGFFALATRYGGQLQFRKIAYSTQLSAEMIPANEIVADGLLMADYQVKQVSQVVLKKQDGSSVSENTGWSTNNPMTVFGGALLNSISTNLKNNAGYISPYYPCEAHLTEHNPAVECGDKVYVMSGNNIFKPYVGTMVKSGVTWTDTADGRTVGSGTSSSSDAFSTTGTEIPATKGTYTITFFGKHKNAWYYVYDQNNTLLAFIAPGEVTESATFTVGTDFGVRLVFDYNSGVNVDVDGYTMLSPLPYQPQIYEEPSATFLIPVMRQTIQWNGKTYGSVVATGNQYRLPPDAETQNDYNVQVANQPEWEETASDGTVWKMQRLPNGTVIGIATINKTLNFTTAWGSLYRATVSAINLPSGYTRPYVFAQTAADTNGSTKSAMLFASSFSNGKTPAYWAARPESASSVSVDITYVFIAL